MKFIVFYNTGVVEGMLKINTTLLHMMEVGTVKSIVDIEDKKVWKLAQDGKPQKENICIVEGLT